MRLLQALGKLLAPPEKQLALRKRELELELRAQGWSVSRAKAEVARRFRR